MKIKIMKRNKTLEGNGASGTLDALREDALLPAPNMEIYRMELRKRLTVWLGRDIMSDDDMELLEILEGIGTIEILNREDTEGKR